MKGFSPWPGRVSLVGGDATRSGTACQGPTLFGIRGVIVLMLVSTLFQVSDPPADLRQTPKKSVSSQCIFFFGTNN